MEADERLVELGDAYPSASTCSRTEVVVAVVAVAACGDVDVAAAVAVAAAVGDSCGCGCSRVMVVRRRSWRTLRGER